MKEQKKKWYTRPLLVAVLYTLCAVIWMFLAYVHWEERPLELIAGVVWLIAAAAQWFRVIRAGRES